MSQEAFQPAGATDSISNFIQGGEVMGSQTSVVPQGGRGTRGAESPRGVGGSGGGGGGGGVDGGGGGNGFGGGIRPNNYVNGGGSLNAIKNMISMQSKRLAEDVNSVYDKQIMYTTKIQFQRSRIEDLTFRIAKAEKELEEKRKSANFSNYQPFKAGLRTTERETHKIENRLQQTLAKASMLDAANIHRKECVDSLRREKMAETKAKKRLETELERAKEICASTTRATQQMVDDKEKTRREIEILKQEVVKDLETFRGEFHGMADSLVAAKEAAQESNAHLEYMARSRNAQTNDDKPTVGGGATGRDGDGEGTSNGKAGVQPLSRTQRLRQQSNMAFWLILKKKNDLQAKATRVQELRSILEKISAATSLATLDDFVPVMLEAEDENYNLFEVINELNRELEELEHEKSLVKDDINQLTRAGSKSDQHAVKRSLQQQIDRSRSMAEMHDHAYSKDVEVIKSVEDGLISVFNKVGSSDKAVSKQLSAMGVTDRNILLFLAQIEEQIEHIVQVYNAATDSTTTSNVRRPFTPVVNQVTGERVPSMCPPHPPSSDSIDDILGTALEEDLDDAYRPINTARVAVTIKEQILRMPQGTKGGGTARRGIKAHHTNASLPRSRTVGVPPEKTAGGGGSGALEAGQDLTTGGSGGVSTQVSVA